MNFSRRLAAFSISLLATSSVAVIASSAALADQNTSRLWAIREASAWERWAPAPFTRWDVYNDLNGRVQLVADPRSGSAVYFLNADGSVGFRNVDQNINKTFPGISAKQIAVGKNGRLWAILSDGNRWARWAPGSSRWDVYNDLDGRVQLVGDPNSEGGIYFLNADGSVGHRNVDQNANKTFPGINAKQIAVGKNGRLWAILSDGNRWARWAPAPFSRWDIYNDLDGRVQLVGDPDSEGGIYFRRADGSVGFRNVDQNVNKEYPDAQATELTVSDPN